MHHLRHGARRGPGLDERAQAGFVRAARRICRIARLIGERRLAEDRAQLAELGIARHDHRHMPVARGKDVDRRGHRMAVPHPGRRASFGGIARKSGELHGKHRVEHGEIDDLAVARALALPQRGEHRPGAEKTGGHIGDRFPDRGRRPVRRAGDGHEARHRLDDEVVRRPCRELTRLPEAGNTQVDEPRVARAQPCRIDLEPRGDPGAEVLYHHVAFRRQRGDDLAGARGLEVERDALLVAVEQSEIDARLADEWAEAARIVARARRLDLDHLGAEVGEQRRAIRPRHDAREIEHANAREQAHQSRNGRSRRCRRAASIALS
jgi:hypothetical protein